MTPFWTRLLQVNARRIMWIVLPLCQVVLLLSLWQVARTRTGQPLGDVQAFQEDPSAVTNRFPLIWQTPTPAPTLQPGLFDSQYLWSLIEQQQQIMKEREAQSLAEAAQRAAEAAAAAAAAILEASPVTPVPDPVVKADPPEAPPRRVTVTYRGMMTRLDGQRLALIQSSEDESEQYFTTKSEIAGHRIHAIERHQLSLLNATNTLLRVQLGQAIDLEMP
ncbi:MAG: hypothetical protein ACI9TH_003628 [Kiritimatiellia bacterium]|jgi:hypothetical protein